MPNSVPLLARKIFSYVFYEGINKSPNVNLNLRTNLDFFFSPPRFNPLGPSLGKERILNLQEI